MLTELELKVENMHDWGYEVIQGRGAYEGQSIRINVENENIIAFDQDGKLRGMIPDALCVFKSNGQPVTNADLAVGMELSFVVVPCNEKWLEDDMVKVFDSTLHYFGYEDGFVPISALNAERK
ncbi:hypothetical protein SDC9_174512 [bioreactor metagenome]|uniref:S-Me-THD-like C-terminal domain-containing protein n=1 Tax=bioreactor metagenome TaxID=1076179 RepID=A0A645GK44_9ZZZZ